MVLRRWRQVRQASARMKIKSCLFNPFQPGSWYLEDSHEMRWWPCPAGITASDWGQWRWKPQPWPDCGFQALHQKTTRIRAAFPSHTTQSTGQGNVRAWHYTVDVRKAMENVGPTHDRWAPLFKQDLAVSIMVSTAAESDFQTHCKPMQACSWGFTPSEAHVAQRPNLTIW